MPSKTVQYLLKKEQVMRFAASFGIGLLVTLLVTGTGGSFFFWYTQHSNDLAPDSSAGFGFAVAGTVCFVLAAICYTFYRRSQRRVAGQLNGALHWHAFFALMGFALIMMHSFGNFNAKTGTYALYGLMTLLVSGFVGRLLDHHMPHLIAREVDQMLTVEGEDRIESMARNIDAMIAIGIQPSWEETRLVSWQTIMVQTKQQVAEVQRVQKALQRERCYRYMIVYWRRMHLCLAVITIGLIIWHLVYVAQLLVPGVLHRG
jgi:predicted transporter